MLIWQIKLHKFALSKNLFKLTKYLQQSNNKYSLAATKLMTKSNALSYKRYTQRNYYWQQFAQFGKPLHPNIHFTVILQIPGILSKLNWINIYAALSPPVIPKHCLERKRKLSIKPVSSQMEAETPGL